jgi:hypothetical protein
VQLRKETTLRVLFVGLLSVTALSAYDQQSVECQVADQTQTLAGYQR